MLERFFLASQEHSQNKVVITLTKESIKHFFSMNFTSFYVWNCFWKYMGEWHTLQILPQFYKQRLHELKGSSLYYRWIPP